MPVYWFNPNDPEHPDWNSSSYNEPCLVHAPSQMRARQMLNGQFDARGPLAWADRGEAHTPWLDPERAKCRPYPGTEDHDYREGLIFVLEPEKPVSDQSETTSATSRATIDPRFGERGVWVAINEDDLPSKGEVIDDVVWREGVWGKGVWGKSAWGRRRGAGTEALTSHDPHFEPSAERGGLTDRTYPPFRIPEPSTVTREVIVRVVQHRAVLQFQVSRLLDYMDELIRPEGAPEVGRNAPFPAEALGITEGITDAELLTLLRDLRDELRRFNDALENGEVDEETLSNVQAKTQSAAGRIAFYTAVGVGGGGLFITALGGLLDSAGLVEWEKFIEFIQAVRGGG